MEHALPLEALGVDAQGAQDAAELSRVPDLGRHHRLGAAIADEQAIADAELAAARVAAEIVVVVEDQDARLGLPLAIGPGRRQTGKPCAHYDEIVGLLGLQLVDIVLAALAGDRMDDGVGIVGRAPEPRESRRIGPAPQRLGMQLLDRA